MQSASAVRALQIAMLYVALRVTRCCVYFSVVILYTTAREQDSAWAIRHVS